MSFTSRAVESLRERVRELVGEVVLQSKERGRMELVGDLALPVPFTVISEMLGISTERSVEVREWSKLITGSLEPTASLDEIREAGDAMASFVEYLKEVISEKKRRPADDMISSMVEVQRQGDPLTDDELAAFALLLYVAGHETTVNVIGNSVLSLLRNPDQARTVREGGIDTNGVDELLRIDAPVQLTVRIPLVPVFYTVDGERIQVEPGEMVMTSLGGANHDPAVFSAPGLLDLGRENAKSHMSFAAGIHYCMGAGLARMQAQETLGALFQAFPEIHIDGGIQWRDRLTLRGVEKLELLLPG
jgi:cytochrome P450